MSEAIKQLIRNNIQQNSGAISFADFMQLALYAPGLGYYSNATPKFGTTGDFVTAPELGSLFAGCLAKQCMQILNATSTATILEIGAGTGQLACDLIIALQQQNFVLENYLILELSSNLRQRQQQKLQQCCPNFYERITWLDKLPSAPINGVIIGNEVLDAMPITRFRWHQNTLQEFYVQTAQDSFEYKLCNPSDKLNHAFNSYNIANYLAGFENIFDSEINLWLEAWIASLSECLASGAILLCDYGFGRSEYYHPQRNMGTLMCHYQHYAAHDPFNNIGQQDITAHVDFTAVAEAADASGLQVAGYTNLASFLINCGILATCDTSLKQKQELQILTSPAEMGELFKIIALTKNMPYELIGFMNFCKLHYL